MTNLQKDFKVFMESCGVNATSLIALDAWRIYKAATERAAGIVRAYPLTRTEAEEGYAGENIAEEIRGEEPADD